MEIVNKDRMGGVGEELMFLSPPLPYIPLSGLKIVPESR